MLVLLCTVFLCFCFCFSPSLPLQVQHSNMLETWWSLSQVSESETPSTGDWGRLEAQASSFSRLSSQDIPSLGLFKTGWNKLSARKAKSAINAFCCSFVCHSLMLLKKMNKAKSCQAWFWVAGLVGLELLELAGLPGWWMRSHYCCPNILVLAMNSE